jgi:hypothetical protein
VLVLLAPLPAVAVGAAVARAQDIPIIAFAPNLLAMLLGMALVLGCRPGRTAGRETWTRWLPVAGAISIGLTLLSPGLDGVHRWLVLGPVRLNASTAVSPWLLAGVYAQARRSPGRALALLAALLLVHVLQPDAAQATALALAGLALIWRAPPATPATRAVAVVLVVGIAGLAWSRPDPLPALDHVERVLVLGLSGGPGLAVASVVAMALLLAPMLVARSGASRAPALGFAVYVLATVAATFCGNYPVPVMGAGAGPVLGWYAMVAYLRCRNGTAALETERPALETERPALETERPALETERPAAQTEGPALETEGPALETERPAAQTEGPALETERPAAKTEGPAAKTEGPALETERPAAKTEGPALETERPAAKTEGPALETERPALETEGPALETEGPAAKTEGPAVKREWPAAKTEGRPVRREWRAPKRKGRRSQGNGRRSQGNRRPRIWS